MAYEKRYSRTLPGIAVPEEQLAPGPAVEDDDDDEEEERGASPMWYDKNGNFKIGQKQVAGSYAYYRDYMRHISEMIKEELMQAAKAVLRKLKLWEIRKDQIELLQEIARTAKTADEFWSLCNDEPFLHLEESPCYDPLCGDEYDTLDKIAAWIAKELAEYVLDIEDMKKTQQEIAKLGGPAPVSPAKEGDVASELQKVQEKISDIEPRLVPTPGPMPAGEPTPESWPLELPEPPFPPTVPEEGEPTSPWAKIKAIQDYLIQDRAYKIQVLFNISWCLEFIRVCLAELQAAKAPGAQTANFKGNLKCLNEGTTRLEMDGVFHD